MLKPPAESALMSIICLGNWKCGLDSHRSASALYRRWIRLCAARIMFTMSVATASLTLSKCSIFPGYTKPMAVLRTRVSSSTSLATAADRPHTTRADLIFARQTASKSVRSTMLSETIFEICTS